MEQERAEFKAWLKKNRPMLRGRTPDEVAFLARLVGWNAEIVYAELSHFETAIRGGDIHRTATFHIGNEVAELEKRNGKIDLYEQWSALKDYLIYGTEFNQGGR